MMQAVSCSGLTVYFDRNSGIRSSGTTVHFRKNKQFAKGKQYALYFASITDEKSKVYQLIHTPMEMLQLGEGYSFLMRFFPNRSYRVKSAPVQRYDSMIYLYEGNPIELLEEK